MHSVKNTLFYLDKEAMQQLDAKLKEERRTAGEKVSKNCFELSLIQLIKCKRVNDTWKKYRQ